ncbi:hypothetical protein GCM10020295_03750 [Streptomyces cinereospinus]
MRPRTDRDPPFLRVPGHPLGQVRSLRADGREAPWPVWTTVSGGRENNTSRMERMIVGKEESDLTVAPGPPAKRVSPVKTASRSGAYR